MNTIIPIRGAAWKHSFLEKIASTKDFPTRLRLFHLLKKFFGLNFLVRTTPSKVRLFLNIQDWVQYQIYFFGNYEKHSISLFKKLSKESKVVFDIGSHIGQFALEAAIEDPKHEKKIIAIEANPYTFAFLINNIRLNNFKQIVPILGAVHNYNSILKMTIPSFSNLGNTQIAQNSTVIEDDSYFVSSVVLEDIMKLVEVEEIDLMKIDIEGYEYFLFERIFQKGILPRHIIFEYIPEVFKTSDLLVTLMQNNGYKIYTILGEEFVNGLSVIEQNLLASRQN